MFAPRRNRATPRAAHAYALRRCAARVTVTPHEKRTPQSPLAKLTSREIEILRLLSAGKSLSEIAWLVHSSYKTIANTSSIIRQKLGLRSSSELVRFAIESRLV